MRYFTKLKVLWNQLDVFHPNLTCHCNVQYNCGAFQEMKVQKESNQIIRFLKGLNEQFSVVKS